MGTSAALLPEVDDPRTGAEAAVSRVHPRVPTDATLAEGTGTAQQQAVDALMAAVRVGERSALLATLHPAAVLRVHRGAVPPDALRETRGAAAVADVIGTLARLVPFARRVQLDGRPALLMTRGRRPLAAAHFVVSGGRVRDITVIADPARLRLIDAALV